MRIWAALHPVWVLLFSSFRSALTRRPAALVVGMAIVGFSIGYTPTFASPAGEVTEGQTLPALTTLALPDHQGERRPLLGDADADDPTRATLVVLYRGHW